MKYDHVKIKTYSCSLTNVKNPCKPSHAIPSFFSLLLPPSPSDSLPLPPSCHMLSPLLLLLCCSLSFALTPPGSNTRQVMLRKRLIYFFLHPSEPPHSHPSHLLLLLCLISPLWSTFSVTAWDSTEIKLASGLREVGRTSFLFLNRTELSAFDLYFRLAVCATVRERAYQEV